MRKALASVVIIAFAGLLCTSLLAVFDGTSLSKEYHSHQAIYPYYMVY